MIDNFRIGMPEKHICFYTKPDSEKNIIFEIYETIYNTFELPEYIDIPIILITKLNGEPNEVVNVFNNYMFNRLLTYLNPIHIYKYEIEIVNNIVLIHLFNNKKIILDTIATTHINNEFVFYYVEWNKHNSIIIKYLLDNNICEIKKKLKLLNNKPHYLFKLTLESLILAL